MSAHTPNPPHRDIIRLHATPSCDSIPRMAQIAKLRSLLMSAFGPALAIVLLALFAGYAVLGSNGILAWGDYSRALEERRHDLAKVKAERDRLKNRVDLVDPRHADPDMVDELVRRELNVGHPDEVIVPLR